MMVQLLEFTVLSLMLLPLSLDSLKRPDGFRKNDLLTLLDISQRVALAVETDRFASDLAEVARSLTGDKE